jgi:hypothetical protein
LHRERSIDVPFDDFMAGEHGVAERVYGLVGTSDRRRPYRDESTWPATSEADSAAW